MASISIPGDLAGGAVRLLASCHLRRTSALLLELCVPGTALSELKTEYRQDEIVARLFRRLWIEPAAGCSRPEADGCGEGVAAGGAPSWREASGASSCESIETPALGYVARKLAQGSTRP